MSEHDHDRVSPTHDVLGTATGASAVANGSALKCFDRVGQARFDARHLCLVRARLLGLQAG
jgi:hypothetical protein